MPNTPRPGVSWGLHTLRTRIILSYGVAIALCLLAYSVTVATSFKTHLERELDHRVHEDIELAARAIVLEPGGVPSWAGGFLGKSIEEEEGGGHLVEVWDANGVMRLSTGTFHPELSGFAGARADGVAMSVETPSGPVRMKTEAVDVEGTRLFIRAAVSEVPTRAQIHSLWTELFGLSIVVLILGGIVGVLLANRLVGPLSRMASHARRITAEQLHERLDVKNAGEELEHLGDAFNATLARLEGSFAQLRRFTADASHEIRTPLTAMRSVGEVALQGTRSMDEYRDVIGTMLEEVERLSRLADGLLTLARAEAGQTRCAFERIELRALAEEAVEQLGVLAEEREQRLEVAGERAHVDADRLTMRQALVNLIDNAIKYSGDGSHVTVRVGADGANTFVSVEDDGPGIAAEHLGKIFDRFYRVDSSRSRVISGTGLGLSLVKLTAEAHGGRVEVESIPGRGSTFRIVLPQQGTL
ncbi:MAG: sensor histidine kinase [Thermoanaerobaculia bacterium]